MSQSQVPKIAKLRKIQLAMRHPNLTISGPKTGLETEFTRQKKMNFNFDPSSGAILGTVKYTEGNGSTAYNYT